MAQFRVKAFFMHEHEAAAAKRAEEASIITDTEWTDGYVMGIVDESQIAQLVGQGLVITPVEQIETEATAPSTTTRSVRSIRGRRQVRAKPTAEKASRLQEAKPLGVSILGKDIARKILSPLQTGPQFYVVRLNGPLTEQRRAVLQRLNVQFLERLSNNKYTSRLEPAAARELAAQPFVDSIRLYNEADTLRTPEGLPAVVERRATRAATRTAAGPRFTGIYAVRLHRAEDVEKVVRWLRQRGREPLATHADVLRVGLVQGSYDVIELAKLPEVAAVEEVVPCRLLDRDAREIMRLEANRLDLGLYGRARSLALPTQGLTIPIPIFRVGSRVLFRGAGPDLRAIIAIRQGMELTSPAAHWATAASRAERYEVPRRKRRCSSSRSWTPMAALVACPAIWASFSPKRIKVECASTTTVGARSPTHAIPPRHSMSTASLLPIPTC
jgi:serine protease AprX